MPLSRTLSVSFSTLESSSFGSRTTEESFSTSSSFSKESYKDEFSDSETDDWSTDDAESYDLGTTEEFSYDSYDDESSSTNSASEDSCSLDQSVSAPGDKGPGNHLTLDALITASGKTMHCDRPPQGETKQVQCQSKREVAIIIPNVCSLVEIQSVDKWEDFPVAKNLFRPTESATEPDATELDATEPDATKPDTKPAREPVQSSTTDGERESLQSSKRRWPWRWRKPRFLKKKTEQKSHPHGKATEQPKKKRFPGTLAFY